MFSSTPWPLLITDRSPPSPVVTTKNVSDVSRCSLKGRITGQLNHCCKETTFETSCHREEERATRRGARPQGTVAESKEQ